MNRRKFLKTAAAGAAAAATWRNSALMAQNTLGANDRINIGLIGCGGRGMLVGRLMNAAPNVAYIGFCDVSDDTVNQVLVPAGYYGVFRTDARGFQTLANGDSYDYTAAVGSDAQTRTLSGPDSGSDFTYT